MVSRDVVFHEAAMWIGIVTKIKKKILLRMQ